MPGFFFHVGAAAMCPHAGQVTTVPGSPRVKVSGQPVATKADQFLIAGCAFNVSGKPQPCLTIEWLTPAVRVKAGGQPVILSTSMGLSKSGEQVPQGSPIVTATQVRVKGT